jgi:hypothetical protein
MWFANLAALRFVVLLPVVDLVYDVHAVCRVLRSLYSAGHLTAAWAYHHDNVSCTAPAHGAK